MNNKDKNNQINLNDIPNDNNEENIKELLIKELSENLNIEIEGNESNINNNNNHKLIKNSLTTIQEENSESFSHPSYISNQEKKSEIKKETKIDDIQKETKNEKIEESIIPGAFDNNLISFNGDINDIENIVENLQFNTKQEFSILVEDYLEAVEFDKISQEQIKKIIQTVNPSDISNCKKYMETLDYDGKTISKISDVNYLLIKAQEIENKDMDDIKKIIEEKGNGLFAWREMLPGNDSFYRAIMFSFLEEIILSRNINNYMTFLYELNKNIENTDFKKKLAYHNIDYLKPKIYLILIYYALTIKDVELSIEKSHSLLIKTYNCDINFDLLLILNLKFLIYKYLKYNEKKLYTREYSVQMGNLLPSQYKTKKGYNFTDYYNNKLLLLNNEPDKISISVIPFILRRDLFIYYFEQKKINQMWIHADGKKNKDYIPFRLVILNGSYVIIYQKEYYNQFQKIFSKFTNISNNKIEKKNNDNNINDKILENIDEEEGKKINNNNNLENENNFSNNIKLIDNNLDNKTNNQNYINENNQLNKNNLGLSNQNNGSNYSNNSSSNNINNYQININSNINNYNSNNNLNNNNGNINFNNNNSNLNNQWQNNLTNNYIMKKSPAMNNYNNQNNETDALEAFLGLPLETKNKIKMTVKEPTTNRENTNLFIQSYNQIQIKNKSDIINNPFTNKLSGNLPTKECPSCKKPGKDSFYCETCLLNCLIIFVQNSYIQFIKMNISNLIKDRPKENLSKFLKNLVIIFPNKLTKKFYEAYSLLSDNKKNFLKEKLKNFRTSLCLGCFKVINKENNFVNYSEKGGGEKNVFLFKFPCECVFCSSNCLKRFINAVPITKIKSFICGCGVEYEYIQLKFLLYFAISHNLIKFKNEILRYMYEIIKNKCCKCNIEIPLVQGKKNNVNIMEITDVEAEKIFGIHIFNHLICEKCVKSKEISKNKFYCNLCSSEHSIITKKKIKNCEIRNTCSIF